jgi:Family of unknown function (DUF6516)
MRAELLFDERHVLDIGMFVEIIVWRVPRPLRGSSHRFKYRLVLIADGICVLRYDNEAGKGDHCHIGKTEKRYNFKNPEVLLTDFWNDVDRWRR